MKKYTTDFFKEKVKTLVGEEYEVIGEYINSQTKIKMKHNKCGCEYEVIPNSFLRGIRCPKCGGTQKYTTASFKEKVRSLVGLEYEVIGDYINNKTKIKMKHNKCGYEYEVKPNYFISGNRCPKCAGTQKYTTVSFKEKVRSLVGSEYDVIGDYINNRTKIKMKHNICGYEYDVQPNSFIAGHRCPHCYKSIPYDTNSFKKKIFDVVGDAYSLIGEYKNSNTKIKLKHNVCGHEYEVMPQSFLRGNRCPKCNFQIKQSLPEVIVAYFVSKHFSIVQSYRPEWLQFESGQYGEFDIWIPSLKVGIEYDGNIHKSIERYSNDIYKNDLVMNSSFCEKLIRIRELKTKEMFSKPPKLYIIAAKKTIAITSKRGIDELERIIRELLLLLNVKDENIFITDDVINDCQRKVEENYIKAGKPNRSNNIKTRKSNTLEFKQKVYDMVKDEYTVLGEYKYALEKVLIRHNKCGYEYEVRPNSFISGNRCPKCAGTQKYTTVSFKEKVRSLVGSEYDVIGDYINNRTKIKMKHNICGYEYEVKPNSFINGHRCPHCYKSIPYDTNSFKQKIYDVVGDAYSLIGEYKNSNTKIKLKHNICGYEYEVLPQNFLRGNRCPKCSGMQKYTTESFKEKVMSLVGLEYDVIGDYINNSTKIKMKHNICGYEYEVRPKSFLRGSRCPNCNKKKGS